MGEGAYKEAMLKYGQEFGFGVPSNAENLSVKEIQEFYNKPSGKEKPDIVRKAKLITYWLNIKLVKVDIILMNKHKI